MVVGLSVECSISIQIINLTSLVSQKLTENKRNLNGELNMLDTSIFRYEYSEDEGIVSIFANDELVTGLADENDDPESIFTWFVNTYSKTNFALNYAGVVDWQKPESTPVVEVGSEKEFWIAVEATRSNKPAKIYTFLAQYQNRPYEEGEEEFSGDEPLVSVDGEYISSVGWVTCKQHTEFDNFYEPISFNDNYKLLGWAEYVAPEFNPQKLGSNLQRIVLKRRN